MTASIFYGLAHVINIVLSMASLIVIISVVISWFNLDPRNQYVRLVRTLTEPLYRPFRRWTSKIAGPFDFAPLIVMLIITFLQKSIPTYLMSMYLQMNK
jgi:YggT family protein